jgi:hypothetical protein
VLDWVSDVDLGVVITIGGPTEGVGLANGGGVNGVNNNTILVVQQRLELEPLW